MTETIEITEITGIDLTGSPPCQVIYLLSRCACGAPSAYRVKWACQACGHSETIFICVNHLGKWNELVCTSCHASLGPYVLT